MTTRPAYDLALNPPYQIHHRAKRAGKHVSASKRRISFKFGFSSASAVAAGRTGLECRGEEHEVVLVWSHVTGKRRITLDGAEVHASQAGRGNASFEHAWFAFGGHMLKIAARGTPPPGGSGLRQFDLELDGLSFFRFKQIYELGCGQPSPRYHRGHAQVARHDDEYKDEDEDEDEDEEVAAPAVDLFDAPVPPAAAAPFSPSGIGRVPSLVGSVTSSASSASSGDEFWPVSVDVASCNERKSFAAVSSEIMCAYNHVPPPAKQRAAPGGATSRALVPVSEEGLDPVAKSMPTLVNLDDLTARPVRPLAWNAPAPNHGANNGQAQWGLVGRAPTLAELRDAHAAPPPPPAYATPAGAPAYGQFGPPGVECAPAPTR